MDQSQPQVQQQENLRAPVDCPCGCKDLTTDGMIKRHLMILAAVAFMVTLGLVALNSYQRDLHARMGGSEIGAGPGATQAAESWTAKTPTEPVYHQETNSGYYVVQPQVPAQLDYQAHPAFNAPAQHVAQHGYQVYNPHYQVPYTSPYSRAEHLRRDAPSMMAVPVPYPDGSTKVKRIVNR